MAFKFRHIMGYLILASCQPPKIHPWGFWERPSSNQTHALLQDGTSTEPHSTASLALNKDNWNWFTEALKANDSHILRLDTSMLNEDESHSLSQHSSFLFQTDPGSAYFVEDNQNQIPKNILKKSHIMNVFPNSKGKLQSLEEYHPQLLQDPYVPLQWYLFQKTPVSALASLIGSYEGVESKKRNMNILEKSRFWSFQSEFPSTPTCDLKSKSEPNSKEIWAKSDGLSRNSSLIIHDGPIDDSHFEMPKITVLGHKNHANSLQKEAQTFRIASDHGTHIAGIIGARKNDRGITGIAAGTHIVSVPITLHSVSHGFHFLTLSEVVADLERIYQYIQSEQSSARQLLHILYMGYTFYEFNMDNNKHWTAEHPLTKMINKLLDLNVLMIAPNGNIPMTDLSHIRLYPGHWERLGQFNPEWNPIQNHKKGRFITVSAYDTCGKSAWFNYSIQNHLMPKLRKKKEFKGIFAPGDQIFATLSRGDFGYLSGTSQAAAQIAAALSWSSSVLPNYNAQQLYRQFTQSLNWVPSDENGGSMLILDHTKFAHLTWAERQNQVSKPKTNSH